MVSQDLACVGIGLESWDWAWDLGLDLSLLAWVSLRLLACWTCLLVGLT